MVNFSGFEATILFDVQKLVRVEVIGNVVWVSVDFVLDFDDVVGLKHPLSDKSDDHPLGHPANIA